MPASPRDPVTDRRHAPAKGAAALRQPEMLVAMAAIVLSLCGLFIALYEASIARRAERASVWPHVEVGVSVQGTRVSISVRNSGVGPARVRAAHVSYRDTVLQDWRTLLRALEIDAGQVRTSYSLIGGRVLGVQSEPEPIFTVDAREPDAVAPATKALAAALLDGHADVVVCYCSVHEECWIARAADIMQRRRDTTVRVDEQAADCEGLPNSAI